MEKKQIGVLAVQGAFAEHIAMVRKLGAEAFEIRQLPDLERPMDGLILPGGESTAMRKLLDELGLSMSRFGQRLRQGFRCMERARGFCFWPRRSRAERRALRRWMCRRCGMPTGVSLEVFTRRLNLPVWGRFR